MLFIFISNTLRPLNWRVAYFVNFYFYTELPDGGSRETDKLLDIVLLDGGLLRRYEFTPRRRAHSHFGFLSQYIFQYLHNISASFSCLVFSFQ